MVVPVKDLIEQERLELAKEMALDLGFANPKYVYSKPITVNSKGIKKSLRKPKRQVKGSSKIKRPKITKKKKRRGF